MSERKLTGHPHRGVYLLTRMMAVPLVVKFGRRNGVHVCAPAETVGEKEHVGIPLGSDREGGK